VRESRVTPTHLRAGLTVPHGLSAIGSQYIRTPATVTATAPGQQNIYIFAKMHKT